MYSSVKNNDKLRKEKFILLSAKHDMVFLDKDEFGTLSYLKAFKLFNDNNGELYNFCQKKSADLSEEICIFDYKYSDAASDYSITYKQTVFFVNSKILGLPEFKMRPEHLGDKIAAYFGYDDINFETYPGFSEKYHLSGKDEYFIRYHFDDKVLRFFSKTHGWSIEAVNYFLIFYAHNHIIPNDTLFDFFKLSLGIYDLFKSNNATPTSL